MNLDAFQAYVATRPYILTSRQEFYLSFDAASDIWEIHLLWYPARRMVVKWTRHKASILFERLDFTPAQVWSVLDALQVDYDYTDVLATYAPQFVPTFDVYTPLLRENNPRRWKAVGWRGSRQMRKYEE